MPIGARQACSNVAQHDAPRGNAPRYVEPDDGIGRPKQVIDPPQVDALGDPGWAGSNGVYIRQPIAQWPLRAGATRIADLIEIGRRNAESRCQSAGQSGLSTSRTADNMDTAQLLAPHNIPLPSRLRPRDLDTRGCASDEGGTN